MQQSILLHGTLVTSDKSGFSLIFICLKMKFFKTPLQPKSFENHSKLSKTNPQNMPYQFFLLTIENNVDNQKLQA